MEVEGIPSDNEGEVSQDEDTDCDSDGDIESVASDLSRSRSKTRSRSRSRKSKGRARRQISRLLTRSESRKRNSRISDNKKQEIVNETVGRMKNLLVDMFGNKIKERQGYRKPESRLSSRESSRSRSRSDQDLEVKYSLQEKILIDRKEAGEGKGHTVETDTDARHQVTSIQTISRIISSSLHLKPLYTEQLLNQVKIIVILLLKVTI